ncbi:MAG TPA: LCP family protein [Acidimicrobiales bacterium]|nr:LCP family protein [Acidimicrobiales bacterium]
MATSHGRGAATRRTERSPWPHRLLIAANVFLGVCIMASAAAYGYLKLKLDDFERVDLACALRNCGNDNPDEPMNVLLVGSDTRANISKEEQVKFGTTKDVGGVRTDTMMILHIDPRAEKAAVLSVPRDLYVPIAGTSRTDRINTAFGEQPVSKGTVTTRSRSRAGQITTSTTTVTVKDGAPRLIATIRESLGIEIDHYIEVDFNGFRDIVSAVGGVTVPFPAPARDKLAGLDVKKAGCVELTGDQALSYVRSRHYQYLEAGRWRTEPSGDIGRIARQQDFIRRMIRRAIGSIQRNPLKLNSLVEAGSKNVKLDQTLSNKDILRVGKRFRSLDPEAVDMLTLPTDDFRVRSTGAAVLKLRAAEAQIIVDRFNGASAAEQTGPPPSIPPGGVRVRVLNGTGISGQASQVMRQLNAIGFGAGGIGSVPGFGQTTTEIRHGAGQLAKAKVLQAYILGGATLVSDSTLRGGDLVLTIGSRFAGVRDPKTATPGGTSTTLGRATSTTTAKGPVPVPKGAPALNC